MKTGHSKRNKRLHKVGTFAPADQKNKMVVAPGPTGTLSGNRSRRVALRKD
jgi:hypothetical protein